MQTIQQIREEAFFFQSGSSRLFGILHRPLDESSLSGFVFCSPYFEEKLWVHRVYVSFARQLAEKGHWVLRFDYMGHGDSEGHFQDSTVQSNLVDIKAAMYILQEKAKNIATISLLGIRFGATLAALVAEEKVIDKLILWEPIIDGAAYMREMLRINLATQSSVYREIRLTSEALIERMKAGQTANVDGYEMAWSLYQQTAGINLLSSADKQHRGRALIVQVNKKEGPVNPKNELFRQTYKECAAISVVEEPFWKEIRLYYPKAENLFGKTLEWLKI